MRANSTVFVGLPFCIVAILLLAKHASPAAHRMTVTVGRSPIGPVNRKIFGGCYNDVRERTDAWRDMGLTTCREGGPGLQSPGRLQPEPGVWKWEGYDAWLDWLKANEVTGIALLSGAAKWMMKGGEKEPADWDYFIRVWSEYAAEVVRHTNIVRKAGLKHWEIWNEPDDGFWFKKPWGGDPEHYSALFHAAARAMKAVDPTIMVGAGGIADPHGGSLNSWWEPCLRDFGVGKTLDFVCLHGYYGDPAKGHWYETIDWTRTLMRKYLGREVPIWITEFNADCRSDFVKRGTSLERQALYVAETLAIFARQNVEAAQYFCIGWYGSDFCPWDRKGARPVVAAYRFWRDYSGNRLLVEVDGGDRVAAVACEHNGTRVLYLPCDTPGVYRIRFTGMRDKAKVAAEAFNGSKVEALAVRWSAREGAGVELRLEWPEGRRALAKIQVRQAK